MMKFYEHIGVNRLELPSGISIFPGQKFQAELSHELESFLITIEAIRTIQAPVAPVKATPAVVRDKAKE